jgi:endoglucanase Acf2
MKLFEGNSFSTELRFSGILPALPDRGDYNRTDLLNFVQEAAAETIPVDDTYWNGKAMARFTHLVHIAEQLGAITERDHFLSEIKKRLEEWFTAGGEQEYVYLENWDVLTGYPSNFGADNQINDHHFHASYAIMSAATIAQYDSAWASQENWGGMVNLLIKDANNWDRTDDRFPFLRSYDVYAGHSWAAGHGDFAEGNNQESSSESMNFNVATILWGEATDQDDIRDLGIFLHTTETRAAEQYWFDIDNVNFPYDYPYVAIGMVWGGKACILPGLGLILNLYMALIFFRLPAVHYIWAGIRIM